MPKFNVDVTRTAVRETHQRASVEVEAASAAEVYTALRRLFTNEKLEEKLDWQDDDIEEYLEDVEAGKIREVDAP